LRSVIPPDNSTDISDRKRFARGLRAGAAPKVRKRAPLCCVGIRPGRIDQEAAALVREYAVPPFGEFRYKLGITPTRGGLLGGSICILVGFRANLSLEPWQIEMAKIEDLIAQIPDERLRKAIAAEVQEVKKSKKFGLVFEEHLPETVRLPNLPVKDGELVAKKREAGTELWRVRSIRKGIATL
jgi:hypothetical protein